MDRGVYVALTGGLAEERRLALLTNNIANASTTGFKKDKPLFKISEPVITRHALAGRIDIKTPLYLPIKTFVEQYDTAIDLSQGELHKTGNPLDVAISGDGFFKVSTPRGDRYTRQGSFNIDREGRLITSHGYPVIGDGGVITLTPGKVDIGVDGTVSVDGNTIDKLKVIAFSDYNMIEKDEEGFFKTAADVQEIALSAAEVVQGHIENANVSVVKEMTAMIEVLRAYESQMKLIHAFDEITQRANEMGRV